MEKLRLLLIFCAIVMCVRSNAEGEGYAQFIGDWVLVSYIVFPIEGGQRDMDYVGYLSYDDHGNMAGLGMPRNLPERAESDPQVRAGFGYWGSVSVDTEGGRVIHHVEGAPTQPRWVGGDNIRYYEFEDNLLKLSLKDNTGRISATLTWTRLP